MGSFPGTFPAPDCDPSFLQALRDLQLANHLESRSIRLRQESLSRLIMTLAGTPASGCLKFLVDSFGSSREMTENQAAAALHVPGDDDIDEEEVVDTADPKASGDKDTDQIPDVCSLADSKPMWPVDSDSLSSTGVPREFYSENQPTGRSRQSTYFCLFGAPCQVVTHQKASLMSHIRRKHLGSSVACKFCDTRWWTTAPFAKHMEKRHPEVEAPARWTPLQPTDRKKQEEEEAAATEKPTSTAPLM